MVKATTMAEMMARDSCDQKDTHAIRLQAQPPREQRPIASRLSYGQSKPCHEFWKQVQLTNAWTATSRKDAANAQGQPPEQQEVQAVPCTAQGAVPLTARWAQYRYLVYLMPYASRCRLPSTAPAADLVTT